MKTPATILDLLHNATQLPIAGELTRKGCFCSLRTEPTPMRIGAVFVWDGATLWRRLQDSSSRYGRRDGTGYGPPHPISGRIEEFLPGR